MKNLRSKTMVETLLFVCFAVVAVSGILLHLKKHGLVIEPRPILQAIHYYCAFVMLACSMLHLNFSFKSLRPMAKKRPWFARFTWLLLIALCATGLTGLIKFFSPVRIQGLGLWHYWCGMTMTVTAILHLCTVLPWLIKKWRS